MFDITPVPTHYSDAIWQIINSKTKPIGALGDLERLAHQLINILSANCDDIGDKKFNIIAPNLIVFAGDHGVAAQGVSIAPSEVTGQMVVNFAQGGAAINVFCRQLGWQLSVVDAGILHPPTSELGIINQRLGDRTKAFNQAQAMTVDTVKKGFDLAETLIEKKHQQGCNLIAFGEMGIGNTSAAAAIMSALLGLPVSQTVGRGTGVNEDVVKKKQQIIEQALALHQASLCDPINVLACLGGFEIVQMTGAMLASAKRKMIVVVDGFIASVAALVAIAINRHVKGYLVFAHCSGEQGHKAMLEAMQVKPLLALDMRLGEGTGAALVLPLIQAALGFYNEMATFEQAKVDDVSDM